MTSMRLSTPSQPSTCAQQLALIGLEQQFHEERRGSWVIGRVPVLMRVDLAELHPGGPEFNFREARATRCHVENLDDRRSLGALVLAVPASTRVGGNSPFSVGRAGEHREGRLASDEVRCLHGVAGGEDVGIGGAHVGIDDDAAARTDLEVRLTRELGVRPHPGCHHDDVGVDRGAVGEVHGEAPPVATSHGVGRRVQPNVHVVGVHVEVQDPRHLWIEPRHEPIAPLDDGGPQVSRPEGFGELEPDVAAADYDSARSALVDLRDDAVHIRDVPQHIDLGVVGPGNGRPDGLSSGAEHQLVVGFPVRPAALDVAHLHRSGIPVDARYFLPDAHIERQTLRKALWRLKEQALAVWDLATDVVRQAAVRERHVLVALKDDNLRGLVESPEASPGGGAGGNPAHNHCLHCFTSFVSYAARRPGSGVVSSPHGEWTGASIRHRALAVLPPDEKLLSARATPN
jgi:hypothetical protein